MSDRKDKTDRVYIRIVPDLKDQVQAYCERNGVTMSALVTTYFRQLLEEEQQRMQPIDADQF